MRLTLTKMTFWNTGGTLQLCDDDQTSPVPMVCWWIPLLTLEKSVASTDQSCWLPTANGPHMCRLFHSHCLLLLGSYTMLYTATGRPSPVFQSLRFEHLEYRCSTASSGSYSQRWWARVSPFLKRNMFMGKQSPLIASVESNIGILISQEEVRCHVKLTLELNLYRRSIPRYHLCCSGDGLAGVNSNEEWWYRSPSLVASPSPP